MTPAELHLLPDWPAVMDRGTAELYLGNRPAILDALVGRAYLKPFVNRRKAVLFRRVDVDAALTIAIANGDELEREGPKAGSGEER